MLGNSRTCTSTGQLYKPIFAVMMFGGLWRYIYQWTYGPWEGLCPLPKANDYLWHTL